jgi:uncharacterized protein YbaA (DUF1428 family)
MSYIDGFLIPVPTANKAKYKEMSAGWAAYCKALGAIRLTEYWGDDVPDGQVTSFPMAVKLEPGETVVFSYLEWPDKATRDAGNEKMRNDPEMAKMEMPFDGKRMIFGGFQPL